MSKDSRVNNKLHIVYLALTVVALVLSFTIVPFIFGVNSSLYVFMSTLVVLVSLGGLVTDVIACVRSRFQKPIIALLCFIVCVICGGYASLVWALSTVSIQW